MYSAVIFVQLVMREAGKEPARKLLQVAEREMLRCIYEWLHGFKLSRLI